MIRFENEPDGPAVRLTWRETVLVWSFVILWPPVFWGIVLGGGGWLWWRVHQ